MITRRQPKNVIIRISKEQNQHGRIYSEMEMESKRKSIIVKILQELKRRHKNLFNNLIINEANLRESLFILIKDENLTKFDYGKFLSKAEQECIIDRLNNIKTNKTYNDISHNALATEEKKIEPNRSLVITKKDNISPVYNNLDINHLHSNIKYEELKEIKEKDEWGILSKKQHMEFVNEKIDRLKKQAEKKKEITQILANQIIEKNNKKQVKITHDERFHDHLTKDYEKWKKSDMKEKEKDENKIREFIEERDNVYKSKIKIYFLKNF